MIDAPSAAVEQAMVFVHARLASDFVLGELERVPIFRHHEDADLGTPPLYEQLQLTLAPAGLTVWCRTNREGTGIEASFSSWFDAREPRGAHALSFDADERVRLRERGWEDPAGWSARWSVDDPERIVAGLTVLATLRPRVLLPRHLPPGCPWPWSDFVSFVLFAEVLGVEGTGVARVLLTRVDGTLHRVPVAEDSPWETLWRAWEANRPELPTLAQWRASLAVAESGASR